MAKRLISTVLTVVMAAVLLTGCVKVVKIGHEGDLTGQKDFNPGDSVEAIWDSEVIPECEKKAVDVADILGKYDGKLTEMGEEFDGLKTKAASYYNYAVRLEGAKITKVDKDSFYGTVTLEVPGYTGKTVVIHRVLRSFPPVSVSEETEPSILRYHHPSLLQRKRLLLRTAASGCGYMPQCVPALPPHRAASWNPGKCSAYSRTVRR